MSRGTKRILAPAPGLLKLSGGWLDSILLCTRVVLPMLLPVTAALYNGIPPHGVMAMAPTYLLRGFQLPTKPGVRGYVLVPLVINVLIFVAVTLTAFSQFRQLLDWLMGYLPEWLGVIAWLVWLAFALLLVVVYGYGFALIGNLIAAPFFGLLSERVQHLLTASAAQQPLTLKVAGEIAWRSFKRELRKLRYFLPRFLLVLAVCLVLSFVPVANLLVPVIGFLWGAWSLSLQYLDYPADNHQISFDALRGRLRERRWLALGFGGVVLLGSALPVINILVMPAAVAGATALWIERIGQNGIESA
jgi:CysZ protein